MRKAAGHRGLILLALGLTLILAACGAGGPGQARSPAGPLRPGVTVAGLAVGGMTRPDAERVLQTLAAQTDRAAQNAYRDPNTKGLVPGTAGTALDVVATLAAAAAARANTAVLPIYRPVAPAITLADLPAAPIYNAPTNRHAAAFVINVAWGEQYLPGMLRTLIAARAPATFCLVGRWAEQHQDLVREIVAAGQASGVAFAFCNHGYRDHGWALLNQAQARESITAADRVIAELTGSPPRYFSPHRGEYNPAVLAASRAAGHELVLWSLDTIDWKNPPAAAMTQRIVSRAKPGDIVLMHPTAPTEQALAAMISGVRAKGLALVTLDDLLAPTCTGCTARPASG